MIQGLQPLAYFFGQADGTPFRDYGFDRLKKSDGDCTINFLGVKGEYHGWRVERKDTAQLFIQLPFSYPCKKIDPIRWIGIVIPKRLCNPQKRLIGKKMDMGRIIFIPPAGKPVGRNRGLSHDCKQSVVL